MRRRKPIDHPHNEVASLMFYWCCERQNWLNEHPEAHEVPLPLRPAIALFCQRGIREDELIKNLSYELRYVTLDHDLLDYVAGHLGVRCQWVESLQQNLRNQLHSWMNESLPHLAKEMDDRFLANCEVIKGGLLHGGLVVLNHGSNLLLGETPGLRVRLVASKEIRIQNLIQTENMNENDAVNTVKQFDEAQENYVYHYFGQDVHNEELYDLNLNGDELNFDAVIRQIVQAMRQRGWEAETRSKRFKRILA